MVGVKDRLQQRTLAATEYQRVSLDKIPQESVESELVHRTRHALYDKGIQLACN
jgi:hypothetical protein